jgi:hypothetical protein
VSATGLYTTEEIYRLLPSVYRVRDAEHGGVLRELIDVIADQVNVLAESIEQLYDDQFVETSAAWVAPYIGDLIGYRALNGVLPDIASPRAEVANTIRYRRRKGTVPVLEQLALDVTGWPARAVEFFELLAATQFMNHIRLHAKATADLRDEGLLELAGKFQTGAFDSFAHTAEMRRIPTRGGRYNIHNVGLFVWRVQSLRLVRSPLVDADDPAQGLRYRFDALGADKPLFNQRRTETEITHIAEPLDVPLPLPRRFAKEHLRDLYGVGRSFLLETQDAGGADPIALVRICNLSDDPAAPGSWIHQPQPADTHVAVDPVLGRVAFAAGPAVGEQRLATFHYGSALAVGGGGYDRADSLELMETVVTVSDGDALGPPLTSVVGGGAVQILDSRRYAAPATITANTPPSGAGDRVVALRSSNRVRPLLTRADQLKLALQPDATIVLDGLVLVGGPLVIEEATDTEQRKLVLRHCTLVPGTGRKADGGPRFLGRASLIVLHPFAEVKLEHCVVGPIVAVEGVEVEASDSVIDASAETEVAYCGRAGAGTVSSAADRDTGDGLEPGAHLTLDSCTVIGKVHAQRLDVSNSILMARLGDPDPWPAPVWAERRQVGCMRFSFVPSGSRTPRRFHCAGADAAHRPSHTSLRYGDPGYMQLRRSTHPAVRTGASDEGSMGVSHELHEPQRETNLRIRLDEYLRYGLEAGIFYAT